MGLQRCFQLVAVFAILSVVFASFWDFAGIRRWLAAVQVEWFDTTNENVTLVLSVILPLLSVALPVVLAIVLFALGDVPSDDPGPGNWRQWCLRRRLPLAGLLLSFFLLAVGALTWAVGRTTSERHAVSVADIEAGQALPGRWLELTGRVLGEERIIWNGPHGRETYAALVSASWQPGQPIAVFVRAREENRGDPGLLIHHKEPAVEGLVDPRGLPAEVRQLFESVELPPTAAPLVLDYMAKPAHGIHFGYAGLAGGLAVLLVTCIAWRAAGFHPA
jgi:hypothetical protein